VSRVNRTVTPAHNRTAMVIRKRSRVRINAVDDQRKHATVRTHDTGSLMLADEFSWHRSAAPCRTRDPFSPCVHKIGVTGHR
jgi:hypothetical protein